MCPHNNEVRFPAPSFVCDCLAALFPTGLKHRGFSINPSLASQESYFIKEIISLLACHLPQSFDIKTAFHARCDIDYVHKVYLCLCIFC